MRYRNEMRQEDGFSLTELMVSMLVLVPIMAGVLTLFSSAVNQHAAEKSSVEMNEDARAALELMTHEIAQAGAHGDRQTSTSSSVGVLATAQSVYVASSVGFGVGDYVDVDTGTDKETVQLTAVGSSSLSGFFRRGHTANVPIRLFALPFLHGVIPPAGMGANSSVTNTSLRFFGDMNGDGQLNYVEYVYDSANAQITRSMTPVTQGTKNPALPLVLNIKGNSVQFTLYTDRLGVVTSVSVAFAVRSTWNISSKKEETSLFARTVIPSAITASALEFEIQQYGGASELPPSPSRVTEWASQ